MKCVSVEGKEGERTGGVGQGEMRRDEGGMEGGRKGMREEGKKGGKKCKMEG